VTKYKIIERNGKFRVLVKKFGFWILFTCGANEGGGSYFIEAMTAHRAEELLKGELEQIRRSKDKWKTVKEMEL